MKPKELLSLIENGEGLRVEFKQRFSTHEKMAKEMIAFANTKGGTLIIGVDDDGSIHGVFSEKGEVELVKETSSQFCQPPVIFNVDYIELFGKELVVINIPESSSKPHRIQDYNDKMDLNTARVFIRVIDKSVPASKEMIKILQARSNNTPLKNYIIGKAEENVFNYLERNEFITVKHLSENANISNRRASRTLIKLVRANLLNIHTKDNGENYFTNSGII